MVKKINIVGLFFFLFLMSYSQNDSSYIKPYNQKYSIQVFSEKKFIFLGDKIKGEYDKMYMPNNPVNLGLGLSIRNTILSFSYGYGFDFTRSKHKGKTESFDFQYHYYNRKITVDAYLQDYKGFYINDDDKDSFFGLAPDLQMKYYSLFSQYVFNGNKFSYKAAVNQSEKQIKSVGSFLLGGGIYYTKIKSDSSFVYKDKNDMHSLQVGVSFGYAYTWVINPKVYISGSVTGGVSIGNQYGKNTLTAFGNVQPRFFAGYVRDKWSLIVAMQATMNLPFEEEKKRQIETLSGSAQLKFIHRLNYFPILSKIFK